MIKKDKIIVSFTTWKKRDKFVPTMLKSIQEQTVIPDKVILWLSEDEYRGIVPSYIKTCLTDGLLTDVRFVKGNTKCYKRWEIFKEVDDEYVVLVDDDFYYPQDYIERLYKTAKKYQKPCCYFEKTIDYVGVERIEIKYDPEDIRNYLYPGFCCIPPGIIKKDCELFDEKYIKIRDTYNPVSDDLWYSLWFKKNGIHIVGIRKWQNDIVHKCQLEGTQNDGLWESTNKKLTDGVSNVVRNFATLIDALNERESMLELFPKFDIDRCSNKSMIDAELNNSVSIIMTAYKASKFIKRAIDSVYSQTYFRNHNNWELLVGVDGCEETERYIKSIMHLYDGHLRVFMMNSNKGTYITSNTLLQLTKYNWILRFDSDDALKNNAIERLFEKSKGYDCCIYKYDIVNADMSNCSSATQSLTYHNGSIFVRSDVIKYLGGYEPWPVSADADLLHCRISKFYKVRRINESMLYYRVHRESLTHNSKTNGKSDIRKKYNNIWKNKNLTNIEDAVIKCVVNDYKEVFPEVIQKTDSGSQNCVNVIYTYVGKNDYLSEVYDKLPGYDYVCFSNQDIFSATWIVKPVPENLLEYDETSQRIIIKTCPHIFLQNYTESIWIDRSDVADELFKYDLRKVDLSKSVLMPRNPKDCVYREAQRCISHKLDREFNIRSYIFKYQKINFPYKAGLPDTKIIIRSHNNPYCINLMELWRKETLSETKLDQITFPYCLNVVGDRGFEYITKL